MFAKHCFYRFPAVRVCMAGLAAVMLWSLLVASVAHAHATILWCYIEGERVYVEAFFMGGNKVQNGKIFVVDKEGNKLLEGITDKQGLFQFEPPLREDMTIVLRVDSGHGTDFKLTTQDFQEAAQEAAAAETK